ncbi:hypothetical protein SAMN06295905_1181 [Devosia lucknowensis]|uniref:Uncharacterized protein n=1 Tax=Devosia lucknowensis TaxID=1096929 RepID=A0A1Y6ERU0_9HYPH|nr:hypothetical protein [Devosia lucknowensis]SMQ65267.1 hypothetical protein SAMN06295905_1181 [Devosia lucknowensis]
MTILYSGAFPVAYGQFYLEAGNRFEGDMARCFAGQSNGLLGARVPGLLFAVTGLHTGIVGLTISLEDGEPILDESWDEIVEVSLQVSGSEVGLLEWSSDVPHGLAVMAGSYRVRYAACNMDAASEADTHEGAEPIDQYRLQLWPASPQPDMVIRQTGATAEYWHDWARGLQT